MRLMIDGSSKHLTFRETEYASNFFCRKLMSYQLIQHLTIHIKYKNLKGLKGITEVLDCDVKPREFLITIRPMMSRINILKTLAHELVHVKQFARKELGVVVCGSRVRWQNEMIDDATTSYWETPWEIEAYGREIGLYNMYVHHLHVAEKENINLFIATAQIEEN